MKCYTILANSISPDEDVKINGVYLTTILKELIGTKAFQKGQIVGQDLLISAGCNLSDKEKYKPAEEIEDHFSLEQAGVKAEEIKNKFLIKFADPELIAHIHEELDKTHKEDSKEKLAVFIVGVSAELPDPDDHQSAALKGDSAAGKDNLMKTILAVFPKEDNFFLTRATSAALEDEAETVKRIAFSEINKEREGANSAITETFKQLAEGGIDTIKKDPKTGFRTTSRVKSSQKTLFYGTTETESDDELETRYVVIPVRSSRTKNKIVVDDSLKNSESVEFYLSKGKGESWIAQGIRYLDKNIQPIIPFAHVFKDKIKDTDGQEKYLFDYNKERIKRDAKRLLALTRAIAWLHQKQRTTFEAGGKKFLYAEPNDFLSALSIFADFFNLTYTGLDHRLLRCLESIKANMGSHAQEIARLNVPIEYSDWVLRTEIQRELNIGSINTIKKYVEVLKDRGWIEVSYDNSRPKAYLIRPINSPINYLSLPVSCEAVIGTLTGWVTGKNGQIYTKYNEKTPISVVLPKFSVRSDEIDRYQNDMSISRDHTVRQSTKTYLKDKGRVALGDLSKHLHLQGFEPIKINRSINTMIQNGVLGKLNKEVFLHDSMI